MAGFLARKDTLGGVSSIVRALGLQGSVYRSLLKCFHSSAICLDTLSALWTQAVLRLFQNPVRVNGHLVLVGDGIKTTKFGKKMPAVKRLHQQSAHKPEYIMGYSLQAIGLLVHAAQTVFAVPLAVRIHEGIIRTNRTKKTLCNKMLALLETAYQGAAYYFVGDRFYAAKTIARGLLQSGNHLITRVKINAVACMLPDSSPGKKKPGRPRKYGATIVLRTLFKSNNLISAPSPVYGEQDILIQYLVTDLLWKPLQRLVRFVIVVHPTRGRWILMSTDTTLDALEIIHTYGLRFKIEMTFKQAVHRMGWFLYRFWMKTMTPLPQWSSDQYLHRKSAEYRTAVDRKMQAYHVFMQACIIAHGIAQYLAVAFPELVWKSFNSWLRTTRSGIPPSEFVVTEALRQSLPSFLVAGKNTHAFTKFLTERQDPERSQLFCMTT